MPYTAYYKHDKDVDNPTVFAATVTAKRDVDIIPKPGRKGDMPPLPEFGKRFGKIGLPEINHQINPHNSCTSNCDIGIT